MPLVKLLVERAGAGDTILLSVPNDALTGVQNPFHLASWGEAALAELRTMLPPDHVVLEQLSLVGSVLHGRDEPPRKERVEVALEPVAGASHLLLTFGARAGEVAQPCRVEVVDVDEHRTWERQREADLAFATARVQTLEQDLAARGASRRQ